MTTPRAFATMALLLLAVDPIRTAAAASSAATPAFRRDKPVQTRRTPPAPPRAPEGLAARRAGESRRAALAQRAAAEIPTEAAPGEGVGEPERVEAERGNGHRVAIRHAPRRPPAPTPEEIDHAGYEAGARTADGLARSAGRREAYRVGVWEGQRAAFEDPAIGQTDFLEGLRAGRLDPGAIEYGSREGERSAYEAAPHEARAQVERQFGDLAWDPVRSPRPGDASFSGAFPATPVPALEAIFRDYPPRSLSFVPVRMADGLREWSWDPWRLHECRAWSEFHNEAWQDPAAAFAYWVSDERRSAFWRSLDSAAARDLFRAAFEDGFWDRLARSRSVWLDGAYAEGFEDGWSYGAFVRGEWSFRRGYAEGFDRGLAFAAEVAFERVYPRAFREAYDDAFDAWMSSSRPVILDARLRDGNDDGVFEPGESIAAVWTIGNLGGRAGRHTVRLDGRPLEAPSSDTVDFPARARTESARGVIATLDPRASTPSSETLVLSVEGARETLPLRVARPVEFTGVIDYTSRPLERSARIAFEIENRSRKTVDGVAVVLDGGRRREVDPLSPGASTTVTFELSGVRPLDLLSGSLVVRAEAIRSGVVWDSREGRFPERATDRSDPALLDYLASLGHVRDPDSREVYETRRLLAQRLAADWDVVRRGAGNPYKEDFRDGGERTALGAVVAAYEHEKGELSRSIAFHGLGDEIAAQSQSLPGANPLLRRWFVRLAARLP